MNAPAQSPAYAIAPGDLETLIRLAKAEAGIALDSRRRDFLVTRLAPRIAALGLGSVAEYAALLRGPARTGEIPAFVEALATHTTSFFRENAQYVWMSEAGIPALLDAASRQTRELTIWSAACSTGQELYSALMTADTAARDAETPVGICGIGTDLSRRVLALCERAVYSGEEIEPVPLEMRRRYLLSAADGTPRHRIVPDLRARTRWHRANLVEPRQLPRIRADIAMLRNVLIYFDPPTRDRVVANVLERLAPGGFLLTGHAETLDAARWGLVQIRPSIYRKAE